MDDTDSGNSGFVSRKNLIKAAALADPAPTVSVAMRPILVAFRQNRLIPDRTELLLELERVKDSFALISNGVVGASITLTRVCWFVRRCSLVEAANKHMVAMFVKNRALFLIDLKVFSYWGRFSYPGGTRYNSHAGFTRKLQLTK